MTREDDGEVLRLLEEGKLEILGLLPRASNYTFLARVGDGGRNGEDDAEGTLAVYKPERGEAPLWDFPAGTLHRREVAAYRIASALGWPWVPPTVLRDGPEGPGSVQLFVPFDPGEHYFTLAERMPDEFRCIALFDVVVNNADRKSGHCLLAEDKRVFLVDHGVCFSVAPKLRTVIWAFAGEKIPDELLDDLLGLERELAPGGPLHAELSELLAPDEIEATIERVSKLISRARFPEPGSERPYPWPPV